MAPTSKKYQGRVSGKCIPGVFKGEAIHGHAYMHRILRQC